ncbi:MAG: hypothetical protein KJ737_26690 [Proteobacteria bacterium]|nr:hypothetical protein [Pseudomonadota bacterium]
MIVSIGEILFDMFPTHKRMGGAPFNFAFHLKKLGFPVRFISRVGFDPDGEDIISYLKQEGFYPSDVQIDPNYKTGSVIVNLDEKGVPDFEILPDAAFDHIKLSKTLLLAGKVPVDLVYFGSVFQRTKKASSLFSDFIRKKDKQTKCMCDINLRKGCFDKTLVSSCLTHADILKLNLDELNIIKEMNGFTGKNDAFIKNMMKTYDIEMVAVTKGADGSEIIKNGKHYTVLCFDSNFEIADTVGAGDGFSAVLAVGYLKKWKPDKIMSVATDFAKEICKIRGAVPEEDSFYQVFRPLFGNGEKPDD